MKNKTKKNETNHEAGKKLVQNGDIAGDEVVQGAAHVKLLGSKENSI